MLLRITGEVFRDGVVVDRAAPSAKVAAANSGIDRCRVEHPLHLAGNSVQSGQRLAIHFISGILLF